MTAWRCRFGSHRWVGQRGLWLVPITRPELSAEGDMEIEACIGCNVLRYTRVAVHYSKSGVQ